MNKGDVASVTFPYTDLTDIKVRPALIISNGSYNSSQGDIVLLFITSKVSNLSPDDYLIEPANSEFTGTGLKRASVFRVGKIMTLSKTLIHRKLGFVGPRTLGEIENRLRSLLAL